MTAMSRRSLKRLNVMKENTEYLELFIIVDDTKFQQGQEKNIYACLIVSSSLL